MSIKLEERDETLDKIISWLLVFFIIKDHWLKYLCNKISLKLNMTSLFIYLDSRGYYCCYISRLEGHLKVLEYD